LAEQAAGVQAFLAFFSEIIAEVSRSKNILVIFDELFEGTNAKDAFDATLAVTQAFADHRNCFFIISTHILEVAAELRKSHRHIRFALFNDKSMFVHMGGSWRTIEELASIKDRGIWYKKAEIYAVIVKVFGNTAILLNHIDLEAVVGGKTVTNPFMVTEVYIKENGKWQMGSLTFSHLLRPVRMKE
jgi:hypothetical protein